MTLNYKFRRSDTTVTGKLNQNLGRVAEINEETRTRVRGEDGNTFRVTDILRGDVVVAVDAGRIRGLRGERPLQSHGHAPPGGPGNS